MNLAENLVTEPILLHRLLLRLAGRVPDSELAQARLHLADGEHAELAEWLAEKVADGQCDPGEAGRAPLRDLFDKFEKTAEPGRIRETVAHRFTPVGGPEETGGEALSLVPMDSADLAVVEAARRVGEVIALWRALRNSNSSDSNSGGGESDRVYLCEARAGADLVEMTAEMQYALEEMGRNPSRVEVFGEPGDLTEYHERALAAAVLVWAEQTVPVRLARVFDGADSEGPYFGDDHLRLTGPDRERVLTYLRSATLVLDSLGTMDDVVRPDRVASVPVGFRSDGVWVWTDAVSYYLEEYDLAPEPSLISHILGGPPAPRYLSRFDRQRVTAALFAPTGTEPVWPAG